MSDPWAGVEYCQHQTITHIMKACPHTRLVDDGLQQFHMLLCIAEAPLSIAQQHMKQPYTIIS